MNDTLRSFRLPVLLLTSLLLAVPAQAQPFEQAVQAGGVNTDVGNAVATDAAGNSYVVGTFAETIAFDATTLIAADDGSELNPTDLFVVKYDPSGTALWARRGGTAEFNDTGDAVAVDADGNVFVAGSIAGVDSTAFFDGGGNAYVDLGPANGFDAAIAKYDADGNLLWAHKNASGQQTSGDTGDSGEALATDASGAVYLAGGFSSTVGFGSETLTSTGSKDAFVVKYDANGNVVWARSGGSAGEFSSDEARGVGVGPDGNVYAMGEYENVATFGSESVQSNGSDDLFVVKYTSDGDVTWLSSVGGSDSEYDFGLGVDAGGNSYLGGAFSGSLLVNDDVLNATGFTDVFVAKFDSSGNAVWGRRGGGDGTNFGGGISADADGNVYYTGYIEGDNVTFGSESVMLQGDGEDAFLAAYRSDGTLRRVVAMGGSDNDEGGGTAVTPDGATVFATGFFRGVATFGSQTLFSAGGSDAFLTRSLAINLPVELTTFRATADGPDALLSWETASEHGNEGFEVQQEIDGRFRKVGYVDGAGTTTEAQRYHFRVTDLAPGRHRFRLRQVDTDGDDTYSDAVEADIGLDGAYALSAAAPNPARTQARLRLTVQEEQSVQVSLYNTLGQRVQVLHDGPVTPGEARAFTVEAGPLASGLYLVRVEGEDFAATRTLTLVR